MWCAAAPPPRTLVRRLEGLIAPQGAIAKQRADGSIGGLDVASGFSGSSFGQWQGRHTGHHSEQAASQVARGRGGRRRHARGLLLNAEMAPDAVVAPSAHAI